MLHCVRYFISKLQLSRHFVPLYLTWCEMFNKLYNLHKSWTNAIGETTTSSLPVYFSLNYFDKSSIRIDAMWCIQLITLHCSLRGYFVLSFVIPQWNYSLTCIIRTTPRKMLGSLFCFPTRPFKVAHQWISKLMVLKNCSILQSRSSPK